MENLPSVPDFNISGNEDGKLGLTSLSELDSEGEHRHGCFPHGYQKAVREHALNEVESQLTSSLQV